jgi:hypothetical protein
MLKSSASDRGHFRAAKDQGLDAAAGEGPQMKSPLGAHILALIAAFATIVAVSALWIVNLRLGPPLGGWVAGPMVIFVPVFLLILLAVWLLVRAALQGRIRWRSSTVALATLIPSIAIVVLNCGPTACFAPGNDRLLGWFVVGGVVVAALVHHLVLVLATPVPQHGR